MHKYIAQGDGFPGDNEFLMLIQTMINQVGQLAALGGDNYILSGCVVNGTNVTDGFVVINGEVLPFEGGNGVLNTHLHIQETVENATYLEDLNNDGQGDSKPTYFYRKAVFGTAQGAAVAWNQMQSYNPLVEVPKALTPVGMIAMWAGAVNEIPVGWALCDGANGTPDLRGKFVVGYHSGNADYNAIGKQGGKKEVVLTVPQMAKHKHTGTTSVNGKHGHTLPNRTHNTPKHVDTSNHEWGGHVNPNQQITSSQNGDHWHNLNISEEGGNQPHENRPPYYTLAYIIYKGQ